MHMAQDLLKVENLTKVFSTGFIRRRNEIVAVNNVNFSCRSGEIVGIIGESGSGKTTLMKMILKLLKPTSGAIYFEDKDIWEISNKQYYKHVQGIFQDPYSSINPVYRVKHLFANSSNLLKGMHKHEIKRRIKEVVELVNLEIEVLDKHIDELSGGQLQRVLLANCLLVDPDIILADEPTSMIDASLRVMILNILKDLSKNHNKLIIFITHDISQAFYICDRILVMYQGRIMEQGLVEDIVFNPQNPYTKRLIADVPRLKQKFEFSRLLA